MTMARLLAFLMYCLLATGVLLSCFSSIAVLGDVRCNVLKNGNQFLTHSSYQQLSSQCLDNDDDYTDHHQSTSSISKQRRNRPVTVSTNPAATDNYIHISPKQHSKVQKDKNGQDWAAVACVLSFVVLIRSFVFNLVFRTISFFNKIGKMLISIMFYTDNIDEFFEDGRRNMRFYYADVYFNDRPKNSSATSNMNPNNAQPPTSVPEAKSTSPSFSFSISGEGLWTDNSLESKPVIWRCSSRSYRLTYLIFYGYSFHRRYLRHIKKQAQHIISQSKQQQKLYSNHCDMYSGRAMWSSEPFIHPTKIDTLAVDPKLRDSITSDLTRFSAQKDYYLRVGQGWKRNYLITGPSGSGKTSLVAAISNFLQFDVYELDLNAIRSKAQLHKLLTSTTPRSIIVVEDVDSIGGQRGAAVSLSDVLNIVDGLGMPFFLEKLIIFTANNTDRLHPALLQPGRMDRRIDLGYCRASEFHILAKRYLGIEKDYELTLEAKDLLCKLNVTPAEVVKIFMDCDGDSPPNGTMKTLVEELRRRHRNSSSTASPRVVNTYPKQTNIVPKNLSIQK